MRWHEALIADQRCLLWINLCLHRRNVCYIKKGHDGWFLLGMYEEKGKQMSYHCPNKYLRLVKGKIKINNLVEGDGHTSKDVVERLEEFALSWLDYNKEG